MVQLYIYLDIVYGTTVHILDIVYGTTVHIKLTDNSRNISLVSSETKHEHS